MSVSNIKKIKSITDLTLGDLFVTSAIDFYAKHIVLDGLKDWSDNALISKELWLHLADNSIDIIKGEIEEINNLLRLEDDCLQHCNNQYEFIQKRVQKTKEYLMKLKEAQKFAAYKYTQTDVQLFADSIKTLDSFSGWYIQNWLDSLTCIINDLLKEMDLEVSFSADKQFLTIINEGKENEYNDLSSGQQVFLNVVFKLAILLNNGITDGIVIIDEGINDLKLNNMLKLLEILKTLPFQVFLVYQNIPEIKDVNVIELERKDGVSTIK